MKIKKSIFTSIVITAIALIILWMLCPICFQNNDDRHIMYLTAGYTTGKPTMGTVFGGFLWAGFIGVLYRIYGGISWYTIVTLAAIAASTTCICHGFIISAGKELSQKIIAIASFIAVFLFSLMYFSAALQYTVTATMVGCAAIITVATYSRMESRAWQIANIVASAFLITCSYSIRKQMGLLSLSAVLLVLFFELLAEHTRESIKRAIIICLAFLIVMGSNMIFERATGFADFNDYYAQAGQWIDYDHLNIADDTDGVYASVGWDEKLYNAASLWYFMDERVTEENFEIINSGYNPDLTINERVDRFLGFINSSQFCSLQVLVWVILLIVFNAIEIINRRLSIKAITIDALFILFLAVSVYFGLIKGRFPLRVYEALLLVYFVPSIAIMLQMQAENKHKMGAVIPAIIALALVFSARFIPEACMPLKAYSACHDVDRVEAIRRTNSLEEYAIGHKDKIYIYDYELSQPANPFTTFKNGTPNNVLYWGGWTYNSPIYFEQLASNGLDRIYASDFVDGNIYICGLYIDETILAYMQSIDPEVEPEIVDEHDGIIIYRYTKK